YRTSAICGTPPAAPDCGASPAGTVLPFLDMEHEDTLLNWKLGAVYKVGRTVSVYANWAISQQPPGGATLELSTSERNANNPAFDPQRTRTFEVGSKWSLIDNALALDLAL